jgi:hypothetical protein
MPESPHTETPEEEGIGKPGAPVETDDDPLILWMLSLTPTQRLEVAQGFADSVLALRNGRRA